VHWIDLTVLDQTHALPHSPQGNLAVLGPGFGWQSEAFRSSKENRYRKCPDIHFFGAENIACLLNVEQLMLKTPG
jgi:hypothetical protein